MDTFAKLMEGWGGYLSPSERSRPEGWDMRVAEVTRLLHNTDGIPSHRREFMLREALTTSDFPYLFGDVLDREVLASYKAVPAIWKPFVRLGKTRRIYPQIGGYRFAVTGGDQRLALVAEKGEYLASDRNETKYTIYVYKYGRQFDISWEAIINDDLGALQDTPVRFATAALRTEHYEVTNLYADDDGTHAASNLYDKATAGEINGSVALLTIANLEAGFEAMAGFLDANGEPILNRPKYLVVPPSLEMTARQILTSASKMWVELGGAGGPLPFPTNNVISQVGLQLIVDPYLPVADASNGLTGWYLFADPADIAAIEADYLEGHERPEICMKASDKVAVGGAPLGPMSGDFATDNVLYRVRDVFGANKLDWRATYGGGLVN